MGMEESDYDRDLHEANADTYGGPVHVSAVFDGAAETIPEAPADEMDALLAAFKTAATEIIAGKQRRVNELESENARLRGLLDQTPEE